MKKKSKKKTKKLLKKIKKIFKGFTLVELLAVIVVLAIIMIIAVPSVLDVMSSSKAKTFLEYTTKVYVKAQEKMISTELDDSYTACKIYNINEMFDTTGNFGGYVLAAGGGDDTIYYITLWDGEYMLSAYEYSEEPTKSDLTEFTSESDEKLSRGYLIAAAGEDTCFDSSNKEIPASDTSIDDDDDEEETSNEETVTQGDWTAHYTNGVMDKCYLTPTGNTSVETITGLKGRVYYSTFIITGGEDYYCASYYSDTDHTTCTKSLNCCTEASDSGKTFAVYYPNESKCGEYQLVTSSGTKAGVFDRYYVGAGLPATK